MATLNITIPDADETTKGIAEVATQAETDTGTDDTRIVTPAKLENSAIRAEVTANNAKVTNATHTGEVTGSGALTVDKTSITNKTLVTAAAGDHVLIADGSDTDNLKKVNVSDFLGGGGSNNYSLVWMADAFNPADSSTFYLPAITAQAPSTSASGWQEHILPVDATNFTLNFGFLRTNAASSEGVTITLRNITAATSVNFTTSWDMGTLSPVTYTASLACSANDKIKIEITTPVFATNPLGVRIVAVLNFTEDA